MGAHRAVQCFTLLMSLILTGASIMSLCGTADSYWEVQEGKQDNTFTCAGLSTQETVAWDLRETASGDAYLGLCPPRQSSESVCEMPYDPIFKPRRISDDKGVMVVNTSASSNTIFFERGRLICSILRSFDAVAGCRLDYIYSAKLISCTVEFRKDTWTVFGQCSIQKAHSSQKRYRCEWIQIKELSKEVNLIANTSMPVRPADGIYVNGTCNFTSYLPTEGQYSYRVTVVPGEVKVNASFIGSSEIRRPSSKPFHNCPQYVAVGDHLSCTCSGQDLGYPPGVLQWNSTLSTQLTISNVQSSDSKTYSCQLLWNNTLEQFEKYTLNLGYSPSIVNFSINNVGNATVNVQEKSHVNMKCISNGTPTPSTRLTRLIGPTHFEQLINQTHTVEGKTEEVSFTIDQVPCEASGVFQCDANNSIGQVRENHTLLVSCPPRKISIEGSGLDIPITSSKGEIMFRMTAYPTPGIKNITYLGVNETADGRPVKENFVQVECSASPLAPAAVSCKIRVVNLTPSHRGFYRVIFTNSFGELPFVFFVKDVTDQEQHAKVQDSNIPAVAGGVSAGFLALVLITITVILWRRWRSKRNDRSREENQASANISDQSLTNVTLQKTSTTEGQETAPYDVLQLEDVGMSSHYEKLQQDIDPSKVVSQSAPAHKTYEFLDSTDIEPAYYDQLTNSPSIRNLKYKDTETAPYEHLTRSTNQRNLKYKEIPYENLESDSDLKFK